MAADAAVAADGVWVANGELTERRR